MSAVTETLTNETIEIPVGGMDCANCARSVQSAILAVPGVTSADVLLSAQKAIVRLDAGQVDASVVRQAIEKSGYSAPALSKTLPHEGGVVTFPRSEEIGKRITRLFLAMTGVVLALAIGGEWLGMFDWLNDAVLFPIGAVIVVALGFPVFRNVAGATRHGNVISHTLMTVGVIAALAIGEWVTAAIVVCFMRVGDYVERYTVERGRAALESLMALAPAVARVERDSAEIIVPVEELATGEVVIVRPGEAIPVDGMVESGHATVNQATITGESEAIEAGKGSQVYASTFATLGSLRVRTEHVGAETTFGRVIKLVEEAELNRGHVQRLADRFSGYFLPFVGTIAFLTFTISRDAIATAAVLVVACSCSLALATPMAMLASTGAAAKHGLLIKGGKHIEVLARANVLLVDKTGTLTLGRPHISDVVTFGAFDQRELLALAAAAERYSEHPLAEAVREMALQQDVPLSEPAAFEAIPGQGIRATVDENTVAIGNQRMIAAVGREDHVKALEADGKTVIRVEVDGALAGLLAAEDALRPEVAHALNDLKTQGIERIEMLTGDNERVAHALADRLGIDVRSDLLPEDKIRIVREYQAAGHIVVMVGDGVNDAPALAQADVGIAMGDAGTAITAETADLVLMRDDWMLVPEAFRVARRTMRTVKTNIGFTAVYNVVGLTLAAFGFLSPVVAAAAQSLPDLGIMANSSRLLRYEPEPREDE
ncbi:MAG: heavy metal translocating P-type ATPase [Thermomicrobiales bacterium]